MNSKKACIYLICNPETEQFKIGVTRFDPNKRLKQLQVGCGTQLHIVHVYYCEFPFRLESILHHKFKLYKTSGEWFALPSNEVLNFKNTCQQIDLNIQLLKDNEYFKKGLK